jgi:uncharacterized protein (DUF1697 family)
MEALREVFESLGLSEVRTLLQSGDAVFRMQGWDLRLVRQRIEQAVEERFRLRCDVVLRTTADMADIITRNPFAWWRAIDPSRLLVTFLAEDPGPEACRRFASIDFHPEESQLLGRELYVYYPDGIGRSRLTLAFLEKQLPTSGTARNWNTVTKLFELARNMG